MKRLRPNVILVSLPVTERTLRGMTRIGEHTDMSKVLRLATRKNSEPPLLFHYLDPVQGEAALFERISQLADNEPVAESILMAMASYAQCDELLDFTSRELEVLWLTGEGNSSP